MSNLCLNCYPERKPNALIISTVEHPSNPPSPLLPFLPHPHPHPSNRYISTLALPEKQLFMTHGSTQWQITDINSGLRDLYLPHTWRVQVSSVVVKWYLPAQICTVGVLTMNHTTLGDVYSLSIDWFFTLACKTGLQTPCSAVPLPPYSRKQWNGIGRTLRASLSGTSLEGRMS